MPTEIKKIMNVRHPVWEAWVAEWNYLINAFEGGQEFLRANYIHRHERESDDAYAGRKRRAYFLNYIQLVIDIWSSYIQRIPPRRDYEDEDFKKFSENVDLQNNNIDEFWLGRIFPLVEAIGMVHIILGDYVPPDVDPTGIITMADQKKAGIRTNVLYVKKPYEMVNWKLNHDGTYEWAVFINDYIEQENWDQFTNEVISYTVFTKQKEMIVDEKGKILNEVEHNLGEVPIRTVYGRKSEKIKDLGLAGMYDVAIINKEVYNISSLIQEFLYKQCFNFLAVSEDLMTDEFGKIKISTTGMIPLSGELPPQYVTPPVDPAEFLQTERDKLITEMYRKSILRDDHISADDPASGISKAYDFQETGQYLSKKVRSLEDGENAIIDLFKLKNNKENKGERTVFYPTSYDVKTLNNLLNEATATFKLNVSATLNKELGKKVAIKSLPNIDKDIIDKIIKEIDAGGNPAEDPIFRDIDERRFEAPGDKNLKGEKKDELGNRTTPVEKESSKG